MYEIRVRNGIAKFISPATAMISNRRLREKRKTIDSPSLGIRYPDREIFPVEKFEIDL